MDTTVFQENCHISFLSLDEHFAHCYTKYDFSTLTHHQQDNSLWSFRQCSILHGEKYSFRITLVIIFIAALCILKIH